MRQICLALFLVAPLTAQPPVIEETVRVTEVLLDALVTDREGNVILGLGPDDFRVTEEGEPVEITSVSFFSNRVDLDANAPGRPRDPVRDRFFIFFFHDRTLQDSGQRIRQMQVAREAREWISESLLSGDWVAVVSYDFKLKLQQDFTQDRQALDTAIRNAMMGKDPSHKNWPSRLPEAAAGPSLLHRLPRGKELRRQSTTVFDALRLLADAGRQIRTRKTLVLLSRGLEGLPGTAGYRPDPRYFPEITNSLNDGNMAIYAVDLGGVGSESSLRDSLHHVAAETGGSHYRDQVSFRGVFDRIADENSGYYLLSYSARHNSGDKGFRKVEIDTVNPEFRVRGRRGFLVRED